MSEEKPQRPEPVLQPTKIVQVDGPMPVLGMPAGVTLDPDTAGPNISPLNPKGARLVMSKRELDAKKRLAGLKSGAITAPPVVNNPVPEPTQDMSLQQRPAPNGNIPYVFPEAAPGTTTYDRNAKAFRNIKDSAKYNEEWLQLHSDGQAVSRAWLQTAVSVSNFINSEASFNSQQIHGLTMAWYNEGLICQIKNPQGTKEFLVPAANIKILEFR